VASRQPQPPRQAWLKVAGTLFILLTAALERSVIYRGGRSSFQNSKKKICWKKFIPLHFKCSVVVPKAVSGNAGWLPGHLPGPAECTVSPGRHCCQLTQPTLPCVQGYGIDVPLLPLILLPLSTNTGQLFSNTFSMQHLQLLLLMQTELPRFGSSSAARKPSPCWQLRDGAGSKTESVSYRNTQPKAVLVRAHARLENQQHGPRQWGGKISMNKSITST